MTDHDVPPDADDGDLLADQPPEVQPPPELRTRVVDALRVRGLIRGAPALRPPLAWWTLTAAAALVAFLGGRMTAATPASPSSPRAEAAGAPVAAAVAGATPGLAIPEGRSAWALLLYEDGRFDAGDLAPQEVARAYDAWGAAAAELGIVLLGEKFADEETLLVGGEVITRPLSITPPPGMLGGMFVVAAPDREAAVALAREMPHHELGGIVVVRHIDRMPR